MSDTSPPSDHSLPQDHPALVALRSHHGLDATDSTPPTRFVGSVTFVGKRRLKYVLVSQSVSFGSLVERRATGNATLTSAGWRIDDPARL